MDSQGLRYLEKTSKHFSGLSFKNDATFTDEDINIIFANHKGKMITQYKGQPGAPKLSDDEIKRVIKHLLNQNSTTEFMNETTSLGFFAQFQDKNNQTTKQSNIYRKNIDIQKTFSGLWRDVRDYKKFKKMVMSGEFEIERYCILAIGQKDEHAEMRMLGFLLNQDKLLTPSENQRKLLMKNSIYFGISKLCCPYCNATLNVFNKSLLSTNETEVTASPNVIGIVPQVGDDDKDDDDVISSEHLSEKAVAALIQMGCETRLDTTVEMRGGHNLRFKWTFPAFARHIDSTRGWTFKQINKVKELTPDKKNVEKNIVYYEKAKGKLRCALVQNASISKEGKKNAFNLSPCIVEFTLNEESLLNHEVNTEHLTVACTAYYFNGFRSQMQFISLYNDCEQSVGEWVDLPSNACEQANLICLQNFGFHEKLVAAFEAINCKVVDGTEQVRMVASTSSSSVDDKKLVEGRGDLALASLLPEEPEASDESQLAEESAGDSPEREPGLVSRGYQSE